MPQFKKLIRKRHNPGLSLLELIIAICIFALIFIGFSSMETFSRYHIIASDRRVKLQNNAAYVLEHMAREIGKAVGDANQVPVDIVTSGSDTTVTVWTDYNPDGKLDTSSDRQIAYQYSGTPNYQVRYYPNYTAADPGSYEVLSSQISEFSCNLTENYLYVRVLACWDPTAACGNINNPALEMKNRIYIPALSTH